ncbi:MAG: hypothetical protein ACJ8FY_23130 [Gemmataceae bacterium]
MRRTNRPPKGRIVSRRPQQVPQFRQTEPDLSGSRDPQTLAKLPEPEQETCRKLWADVASLLKKADNK